MANDYHIVLELPNGYTHFNIYTATLDDLRSRGWKPTGRQQNMSIDGVFDEDGSKLNEMFEEWHVGGKNPLVSKIAYPTTKKMTAR